MANTVPSISPATPCPHPAPTQNAAAANATAATAASAPDRIALQNNRLAGLLSVGAVTAAQLVPGVVEAEGATGAATAIGIGVRAAAANPAVKALLAASAGAAGSYVKSLVHDASAGQPAFRGVTDFGNSLNAFVHASLGIPQTDAQ